MSDWYWAASHDEAPAGERFVIAHGQDELWARVRREINDKEDCAWCGVPAHKEAVGIIEMFMVVFQCYAPNWNRFVFEMARVPQFAEVLKGFSEHECVGNGLYESVKIDRYCAGAAAKLEDTLGRNA